MFKAMNEKIRRFTVWDIACVKMGYPVLIVLLVAFAAKPFYSFWLKK